MPVAEQEIRTGDAIQVGDYEIIPQTRLFTVKFPGHHANLIWNRPNAVVVRTADGQETILAVRDMTRMVMWFMLAGGLLGVILIRLMKRST
jgi:hypothetical protein